MERISLRDAKYDDLYDIYQLICELEGTKLEIERFEEIYNVNLINKNILYKIIEYENELCGFMSLYINNLLHHNGQVMEIQELIINAKHQHKGIGEFAINYAFDLSKVMNILQVEVCTNKNRMKAQNFYNKCGFSESHFKYTRKIDK